MKGSKPAVPATTETMESFKHQLNALMSTPQFQAKFREAAYFVIEKNRLNGAMTPPSPYGK